MIIETPKQLDIQDVSGTFDTIKAGMDESSLPFILEMLSKSFYSNPIGSLVREITSNCFDSHIEANVTDAVVIEINTDDEGEYISFKDVGIGLSPDRIKTVFMNYFTSTKRLTNDQIGGFGLGSKSPLAYTDYFYITTVSENIEYQYLFSKGDTVPTLDLLAQEEVDKHNGTEIKIYIKESKNRYGYLESDKHLFIEALKSQLCYFDNVYFINCNIDNEYIIYESDLFKYRNTSQYSPTMHICFGKVAYPIDWEQIDENPIDVAVGIKFNIEELSVTPNREAIRYTNEVKHLVKQRVLQVKEKLIEIYNSQRITHTNLHDWYKSFNENKYIKFGEDFCYLSNFKELNERDDLQILNELGLPYLKKDFLSNFYYTEFKIYDNKAKKSHFYTGGLTKDIINHPYNFVFSEDNNFTNIKNYYANNKSILKNMKPKHIFYNFFSFIENISIPKERKDVRQYAYNNDDLWFNPQYFHLGSALKFYKLYKYIREQIESTIKPYHIEITESMKEHYRSIQVKNDNTLRRKLEGKVFCKGVSLYNDFDWKSTSDFYIEKSVRKIQHCGIEDFKGIVIYGFLEDSKWLEKAVTFMYLHPNFRYTEENKFGNIEVQNYIDFKKCRIIKIAKNNEKFFKNKPNMFHVKQMYSDNKLFRELASSYKIENILGQYLKHYSNYKTEKFITFMKSINENIGNIFEELFEYQIKHTTSEDIRYTGFKREDLKKEIIEIAERLNLFDITIENKIKEIERYFDGVELLKYIDFNDENKPLILKYLREKKKKLNLEYYRTVIPEPEITGTQLIIDFEPKEALPTLFGKIVKEVA